MSGTHLRLSSSVTVAQYLQMEASNDRKGLGEFIVARFDERYFLPMEDSPSKHGFASLALACLVIETLEAFYQGKGDTRNVSKKMFMDFFQRDTPLKPLGNGGDWFYCDVRCGILHQAEVRNGWRVLRSGPLVDYAHKTLNATRILREVRAAVKGYAAALENDVTLWSSFKVKMKTVCANCS